MFFFIYYFIVFISTVLLQFSIDFRKLIIRKIIFYFSELIFLLPTILRF